MARKSRKHLQDGLPEQTSSTMEKSYIAGVYTRTSSHEQKESCLENQRHIAERYIEENHDIKPYKVYIDFGIYSFDRNRPSFFEMLGDIYYPSGILLLSSAIQHNKKEDFFCGKLYCGICRRKMRLKRTTKGIIYSICPKRDEYGSSCQNKARSEAKHKEVSIPCS